MPQAAWVQVPAPPPTEIGCKRSALQTRASQFNEFKSSNQDREQNIANSGPVSQPVQTHQFEPNFPVPCVEPIFAKPTQRPTTGWKVMVKHYLSTNFPGHLIYQTKNTCCSRLLLRAATS